MKMMQKKESIHCVHIRKLIFSQIFYKMENGKSDAISCHTVNTLFYAA